MSMPAVSVCIPVYNGERFITETLRSVLLQTFSDFEVVVVDNASTDRTAALVEAIADTRIRLVRNEANVGAPPNWSRALAAGRGRYRKLLCADDTLLPGCLGRQVEVLDAHPQVSLVAGQRHIVDESGGVLLAGRGLGRLAGVVAGPAAVRATVRRGTNIFGEGACVMMRGEVVEAAGGFSDRWPYMIDLEYWCRLLQAGSLFALREPLATFRVAAGSWSAELGRQQSRQARSLFRHLHRQCPEVVRSADVRIGSARAALLAAERTAIYEALSLRRRWQARSSSSALPRRRHARGSTPPW